MDRCNPTESDGSPTPTFPTEPSSYDLLGEIGAGVSGVLYKATCLALGSSIVAIKSIDLNRNPDIRRLGAKFMSLISHPNILAHCFFTVDTHLWVVMPFMSGGSLHSIIASPFRSALSIALAIGLVIGTPTLDRAAYVYAPARPALPDLSVLISGPPIKDPGALLRYALPINNKAIREVQKSLKDITESLMVAGVKALDSVERNARQASRSLYQGKAMILSGVAESKKQYGKELLNKLAVGLGELQKM